MRRRSFVLLLLGMLSCNFLEAQLPTYTPTNDLVGFYSFSGNVLDNSGNGNSNANYNIISTSDRFNMALRALYFSGTGTEFLNYGDVDDYEGGYQMSFSFWVRPEAYGGNASNELKPIVSKWSSPLDLQGSSYLVAMNSTDLCFVLTDGVAADTVFTSLNHFSLNNWSHVVITYNYGLTKVYIDNVLVTDSGSAVSLMVNSTSSFKVGTWYSDIDPSYASFTGKIDDLGIWKRELSDCEVEALYSGIECPNASLEEVESLQLVASPNPADQSMIISAANAFSGILMLFDQSGKLVYEHTIDGEVKQIEVPSAQLPEGIYVARITDRFFELPVKVVVMH
ncbi:MAG: hypothetical protein NXI10_14505 [bacterium]|nr:hypothetical protein [bacterium]